MSDIVLVYPRTGMDITPALAPPHSLLAVAAVPDANGMKIKILDQRIEHNWREILRNELKTHPLAVGISTMTGIQIHHAIEVAKFIRAVAPSSPIVWGGKHPSLLPVQTLRSGYADAVCVGEGDYQFYYNVLGQISRGCWTTCKFADLDDLPPTPWHLINVERYIHPDMYLRDSPRTLDVGSTSRGCPFHCGFCSQANEKWRAMSADKAAEMITEAVKRFNLTGIWIRDDEFFMNTDRAVAICEKLIALKIKWYTSGTRVDVFNRTPRDAIGTYKLGGARVLKFGAESGSNRILTMINKGFAKEATLEANLKARDLGIIPAFNFMCGFPSETFGEIEETVDLMLRLKRDNRDAQLETLSTFCPMPGTALWDMALKYGLVPPVTLQGWENWRFDEYDDAGTRNPWYSRLEREAIGNLCYISTLANVVPNLLQSYSGIKGQALRVLYSLPQWYFAWLFRNKMYHLAPEVKLIQGLRRKVMY